MHDHNSLPPGPTDTVAPAGSAPDDEAPPVHSHSMWWMVACCAPMVVLALALLLGVFGSR